MTIREETLEMIQVLREHRISKFKEESQATLKQTSFAALRQRAKNLMHHPGKPGTFSFTHRTVFRPSEVKAGL